ncbi:MAG: spore coat U domain-containing protein [Terracidiphilus sp.]|nr:spore coat U domain-containing protein [Terracidiphilus sp.]
MKLFRLPVSAILAVAGALYLMPTPAQAATATTTFAVTATVNSNCTVTANPLAFGTYSGTALNVSTTIAVTCTNTTAYNVGLSAGNGSSASVTNRLMTNTATGSTQTLNYQLLSGSYTGTNWGNTSATNWVGGTGSGSAQTLTVYGVVPASQYPTPGSYADSITVTINY